MASHGRNEEQVLAAALPIGARTPEEIAVAILAEIVATLREAGDRAPVPAAVGATSEGCCHEHAA
ncbi:MAG: hypothetical protein M3370_04605 [Actinomycetota bacterium]|nr:hypothetical protein [Actinomycetota bacterium]